MPEGPGADLLEVVERLTEISSAMMGLNDHTGFGGGSSGSEAGTSLAQLGRIDLRGPAGCQCGSRLVNHQV